MKLNEIVDQISFIVADVTSAMLNEDSPYFLKLSLLSARDRLRDLVRDTPTPSPEANLQTSAHLDRERLVGRRYCLTLMSATGCDVELYFIDGVMTRSKIMAIKQVRSIDGLGLREAKEIVDSLQSKATVLSPDSVHDLLPNSVPF